MQPICFGSPTSILAVGKAVPGACDRQVLIPGFDQAKLSAATVLFIGAGGLASAIAPTLVRKGVGALKLLDPDVVEASNLSRQFFCERDIGEYKAIAIVRNLEPVCTAATRLYGFAVSLEQAIGKGLNLSCDVAICCVDNNPARVAAARYFRAAGVPVVFVAVSADADHGYVFVQEIDGPCIGCLFPDMVNDDRYPCPGTPAIADILQALAGIAAYAVDSLLMDRPRTWNYRTVRLSDGGLDASTRVQVRRDCRLCAA
jgi:adenylyltransferase/sulfurtransferase